MRPARLLLLSAALLFAACRDQSPTPLAPEAAPRLDATTSAPTVRLILTVPNRGSTQDDVIRAIEALGGSVIRRYTNFPLLAVLVPDDPDVRKGVESIDGVRNVSVDEVFSTTLDESVPLIGGDVVQQLGWRGDNVAVAILDNGFDREHPFLAGRVVEEACFSSATDTGDQSLCAGGGASETGPGSGSLNVDACQNGAANLCDHGQHVAGIALGNGAGVTGAPAAGVAPAARLIAIQVFHRQNVDCGNRPEPCTLAYESDYVAGLDYVYGLRNTYTIASANMSLGSAATVTTTCDDTRAATAAAVAQLLSGGIATVISAGNSSSTTGMSSPSCVSNAVRVGNTTIADAIAETSNRGQLLTLFAPGTDILSSIIGDGFGGKSGTSMAAPHVAGAFAVLRQAFPTETIEQLLERMTSTGVPISYKSGGVDLTTPRLNLLAALQQGSQPPTLTVAQPSVSVSEGATATNSGTISDPDGTNPSLAASRGTVTRNGTAWSWSLATRDGPRDGGPITITATGSKGAIATITFTLAVSNVAPTVTLDPAQVVTANERQTIPVSATFTDPGRDDTHTAIVVCYDLGGGNRLEQPGTITNVAFSNGLLRGRVTSAGCSYGDNGQYIVEVQVRDRDGGEGSRSFGVEIGNVAPTAAIVAPSTTVINGVPTVLVPANAPATFRARGDDPGSDDLTFTWDWKDGTTATRTVFNTGSAPDPLPSPGVNPRVNILDERIKSFGQACLYQIGLTVADDDQGSVLRTLQLFVSGTSGRARSSGYWQTQYREIRTSPVGEASLDCYLQIVRQFSTIFSEQRAADSFEQAGAILQNAGGGGDVRRALDQQLLAAWLNLANGGFGWDALVDTNGDRTPDTAFSVVVQAAEVVRANPNASRSQLEVQKNRIEAVNLMHGK